MINITNLTKVYNSKTVVFRDFNYKFTGNLHLIVGPNGSGKTTLLNCITNYIRYKGKIELDGRISYLPEKRNFEPDIIAKDLIKLLSDVYSSNSEEHIMYLDFKSQLNKKIDDLSKGNKTKLFIICTMLKQAKIYIFDEPTDGLDIQSKHEFIEYCKRLSVNHQILISTHDMGVIDRLKQYSILLDLAKDKNVK